jgi:hypothetical protein
MNKTTTAFFLLNFFIFLTNGAEGKISTGYFAQNEMNSPRLFFLNPVDYQQIYQISQSEMEKNPLSMEFASLIEKRKYKEAEQWLIKNNNHPYYMLNLVFLYLYFNKSEFAVYFKNWQLRSDWDQKVRFIDVLEARSLYAAMSGLSNHWINLSLGFYAKYKWYKKTQNISEVIAGFQLWEKEIEKADHEALLYQQARTEWEKIKPEYLKSYNETKKKSSAVKGQVIDEEKILNNETTRDMLTRYLQNLRVSKNWEKMRSFIHEVQWLSEVEKTSILENISNWENTDSASETNQKNVKIKIQK